LPLASSHGYGLREVVFKEIFPESWISCRKSASALRAVRKKRHPAQSFARSRPGSRPSGGFVAHLAFDHQMTPALFAGAFRASRSRPAHWRTGCRARLRRPSDLKHHAAPDCGKGKAVFGPDCALHPLERWAKGVACTADLTHHAACREGAGQGLTLGNAHCVPGSFGPDCAYPVHASNRGRLNKKFWKGVGEFEGAGKDLFQKVFPAPSSISHLTTQISPIPTSRTGP